MAKARQRKKRNKKKKKNDTEESEENASPGVDAKIEALQYLKAWKKDRDNWRFKKVRQTWLLKNAFELDKISNKHFRRLLKYMRGLQGVAKDSTVKDAEKIRDETMEADDEESTVKHQRAVDILKLLT